MDSTLSQLTSEELARLPVFPLPRVVFFPHSRLPLHLFEPRYLALIEDCLAQGPMAMAVTLLQPGWESNYEGRPPIHTIAGAGRIVEHEKLSDGTYNVMLDGLCRVQLDELPAGNKAYRQARATPLADHGAADVQTDVDAMMACASRIASVVKRQYPEFALDVGPDDSPGRNADRIADRVIADLPTRQRILETLDVGARVRMVTEALGELLGTFDAADNTHRSN